MHAAVVEKPGRPPRIVEHALPQAGPGEVTVTVTAAPITPLDRLCASGTSYFGAPAVPYVPGVQGVGVDEDGAPIWFATSAGMTPGDGSMRGVAAVPEPDIVRLPADADPVLVAALGLSAVAAWMALTRCGQLAAGEQVLVLGAGGVVGQAGVQLARTAGARRVIAAARSAEARDQAVRLGADAVVALGSADDVTGLAERIRAVADGPVDVVLDPLFGVPAAASLRTLGPGGRLVNLGGSASATAELDSATLRSRSLRVLGYTNNALTGEQRGEALTTVVAEAVAGRLTVTHQQMALTDVDTAWSRTSGGRVVLVPEAY